MNIHTLIDTILKGSQEVGTYPLTELISVAKSKGISGIAIAKDSDKELYLAFMNGEPEGAVFRDEKGVLFGDKAVLLITGSETFRLVENSTEIIEAVTMGSRIYDKNRLKKSVSYVVPEIGKSGSGIGVLSIRVSKDGAPVNGIRVSVRKGGKIVGSDITTSNGDAGFRIAYGEYDCILQDRMQAVTKHHFTFDPTHSSIQVSL
ncbi:MAG TPA: hypothetical protein P5217_01180 [Methanoregulaceae archaeon]|nr:hypothetical protein [Methanoregulaceae archaeon]HPD74601.1 hypothetical protein [Methanoregulaceae archaeon]HRY74873.1 hypothetical protein [Methanoregulaceae archaeon]